MTPEERSERSRRAAHARWDAKPYDRGAETQAARDGFWQRFMDQADPEGLLEPHVREQRAHALQRRHFQDLANRRRRK